MIAESTQGLILDWRMYGQPAPAEWPQLSESVDRQNSYNLNMPITAVSSDRGFKSKQGYRELTRKDMSDATCPRDPRVLKVLITDKRFERFQRRRASTELRLAILKEHGATAARSRLRSPPLRRHLGSTRPQSLDHRAIAPLAG